MKQKTFFSVLFLCFHLCHPPLHADTTDKPQYAYIGGYSSDGNHSGVFEFRIKPDGSLQSLRNGPVEGGALRNGFLLDQLLVDVGTRTVYGLSMEGKIYSYAISRTGRLSLKAVTPFTDASEGQVVLDSQQHVLYALDGDNGLVVYNALNPEHLIKEQTIRADTDLQSLFLDRERRSLLVFGGHQGMHGQITGRLVLRYALRRRGRVSTPPVTAHFPNSLARADVIAGHFLAGDAGNMLTVHRMERDGTLRPVSRQPILRVVAAYQISRIAYRRAGSFLYVGTSNSTGDPHITPSASPIIVCRLSSNGHLSGQEQTGRPAPNPLPYLDSTGRFLYVVGAEGTLDAYKIAPDGHLLHSGSRITVLAPTGMVFIGGTGN